MSILAIQNLSVTFEENTLNEKKVLKRIDLTVDNDDFICILGGNGSGKSTLLRAVLGLVPYQGHITLNGKPLDKQKPYQRARRIGIVYQDPLMGTSPNLTVAENLLLSSRAKTFLNRKANRAFLEKAKQELSEYQLGIENQLNTPCGSLSGGMRQVLTLYMATTFDAELLLLDEHTAALDPRTADKVMDITERLLVKAKRIPTLMVTHNLDFALQYGNRLVVLNDGKIVLDVRDEEKAKLDRHSLFEYYGLMFSNKD